MTRFAALFPGQGSQTVGMGRELSGAREEVRALFDAADRALGYSLSSLCFAGPLEELTLTHNAQPALLTAGYAAFLVSGLCPAAAAGHSLGEYTALVAAGALRFEDAVLLVNKRGRYMQEAVQPGAGKMIAVLGPSVDEINQILRNVTTGVAEIANINCPGQTVLAGDNSGIDTFSHLTLKAGAKVIPLNVSAPFHCSLMKPAEEKLSRDIDALTVRNPAFPVYANVTAKPAESAGEIKELLKRQMCSSVRWSESIVNLVSSEGIKHVVEFGAGNVLVNLVKRIDRAITRIEANDTLTISKALEMLGK